MFTGKQNRLKHRSLPKIDILVAIVTASIGLEFLPQYLGIDLKGFSLAWILLPPVLFVSFIQHLKKYLSANVLLWIAVFMLPMVGYAFLVNWDENIPSDYTVPYVLRSFSLSIVILSFYIVHGSKSEGRNTFMYTLICIGIVAAVLNIASILGLSESGREMAHLGHEKYIVRISPLGDPNISTIYLIGFAVSLPLWQRLIGERPGFIVGTLCFSLAIFVISGTASRGGFITLAISGIVLYFLSWIKLQQHKLLILILLIMLSVIIISSIYITNKQFILPQQFETLGFRFRTITTDSRINTISFQGRTVSALWTIEDIFTGPRLFGIGYEKFAHYSVPKGGSWLPHNSFVDLYVIGGIIGLVSYVILWWRTILSHMRCIKSHDEAVKSYGIWGSAFGIGVAILLLSLSIAWTKIIWAFLGIGIALYKNTKPKYKIKW